MDLDDPMIDQLELEIRKIDGVNFVGVTADDDAIVVQLGAEPGADISVLRRDVAHLAAAHLDGEVRVQLVGTEAPTSAGPSLRVRLVAADERPDGSIEVALAHRDTGSSATRPGSGRLDVAAAVLAALSGLGFAVPWVPAAAQSLPEDLGAGTLVVLTDPATGRIRRGVAGGRSEAEATARAVLCALNRFLTPANYRTG
jgi:hypothetical protein